MNRQIRFYSFIALMIIVLCFGVMPSSADEVQMPMMEQQVQQIPGRAVQIKPGQRDKVQSIQKLPSGAVRVQPGQVKKIKKTPASPVKVHPGQVRRVQKPSAVPVLVQPGQMRRMQPGEMPGTMIVLPDLSINRFTISPQNINSGDRVKIIALIKNNGNQILHNVVVRFINMKTHMKLGEKRVTLIPGQVRQLIVTTSIKSLGSATVHSIIDPDNRIKESNERNNKAIAHVTVNMVDKVAKHKQQAKMKIGANGRQVATPMLPIPPPKKIGLSKAELNIQNVTTFEKKPDAPPGGGSWGQAKPDFSFSVELTNGILKSGPRHRKDIVIKNIGNRKAGGFLVGLGLKSKAKIGQLDTWDRIYFIPELDRGASKYVFFKKRPIERGEINSLVIGVDIKNELAEKNESNNYSRSFKGEYKKYGAFTNGNNPPKESSPKAPPGGGSWGQAPYADLRIAIVKAAPDMAYSGKDAISGKDYFFPVIKLKVSNVGMQASTPCQIGYGVDGKFKIGKNYQHIQTSSIPKIPGKQHIFLTILPDTAHMFLSSDDLKLSYIAAVDIKEEVDEKDYEGNNYSKSFKFDPPGVGKATLPPTGKPFKAFDIRMPKKGSAFKREADVKITWAPTKKLINLKDKSAYQTLDIYLVHNKTGKTMKMAEKVDHTKLSWSLTLPETAPWLAGNMGSWLLPLGDYHLRLSTPFAGGWGKSNTFSIYKNMKISRIDPFVCLPGRIVRIYGQRFGIKTKGCAVNLIGKKHSYPMSIRRWKDGEIVAAIPKNVLSGEYDAEVVNPIQGKAKIWVSIEGDPEITSFKIPNNIYNHKFPPGSGLNFQYYDLPFTLSWKDANEDLANGQYKFSYNAINGRNKNDSGWRPINRLKIKNQFDGDRGVAKLLLKIHSMSSSWTVPIEFYFVLRDSSGNMSRTIGPVNILTHPQAKK